MIDSDQALDRKASTGVRAYGVRTHVTCCASCYCSRCDLLVGLDGLHVVAVREAVGRRGSFLQVEVESPLRVEGCRVCGVVMHTGAGRCG